MKKEWCISLLLIVAFGSGCAHMVATPVPRPLAENDPHEIISPNGAYSVILQYSNLHGFRMLFRPRPNASPVFVKRWGSGATAIWSPDSKKVVVTASDETTSRWCELYQVDEGKLVGGDVITKNIQLSVPGLHHCRARALSWSSDSSSVYVMVLAYGDGGSKEAIFLVRTSDGKVVKRFGVN